MRTERGFTLIEIMIGVVVLIVGMTVIWSATRTVFDGTDGNAFVQHAMMLETAVRKTRPDGNYTGITAAEVVAAGFVPERYIRAGANPLIAPNGNQVDVVSSSTTGMLSGTAFALRYRDVAPPVCTQLINGVQPATTRIRRENGDAVDAWNEGSIPITAELVSAACREQQGRSAQILLWMR